MVGGGETSWDEDSARAVLKSSIVMFGIDLTKSNEWTGKKSPDGKSSYGSCEAFDPYELAIFLIRQTVMGIVDDCPIQCYGFGDGSTRDQDVFSFHPQGRACSGFDEVLSCYGEIVPRITPTGPTSLAPIIEMAMAEFEEHDGKYHILLIITDGQVTRSGDTEPGRLSPQEQKTVDAIVQASNYPLSIVLVGVGDGPWDSMQEFLRNIPTRDFDNFKFVNFTERMSNESNLIQEEEKSSLIILKEILSQHKKALELNVFGRDRGPGPERYSLPPPSSEPAASSARGSCPNHTSGPDPSFSYYNEPCTICYEYFQEMAFSCGHQTCRECGEKVEICPFCRRPIEWRINLYY